MEDHSLLHRFQDYATQDQLLRHTYQVLLGDGLVLEVTEVQLLRVSLTRLLTR